ncbi:MAG: TlpA disulfide reductase family protein, partial [Flavobacteriaceae bacterium]
LLIILSFFLVLQSCKQANASATAKTEMQELTATKAVVQARFQDLNGNPIQLSDYQGKRIVLNYWATWCGPCIQEMPSMERAQQLLGEENYLFLLASDQSLEKIKAFTKKKNFDLFFVKFNGALAEEQIYALPATFIYNSEGEKVERIDGATEWDAPEIIQKLKAIQ